LFFPIFIVIILLLLLQVFLRDHRYDAVVHLVTAAIGAEKFYTTANNTVRTETVELAAKLDQMVLDAWMGHKNHFVIDNSPDQSFDDKIQRVLSCISVVIGLKETHQEKMDYFSISKFADSPELGGVHFQVEEFRLENNIVLVKRTQEGVSSYVLRANSSERIISGREYAASFLKGGGDKLPKVKKAVRVFRHKENVLTLETFEEPETLKGEQVLKVASSSGQYSLPSFLEGTSLTEEEARAKYN
jgi:hypothetical protein